MADINEIAKTDALTMKDVSELARRFIVELNGEQDQLQVEEAILSDNGKNWFVTVSYLQVLESPNDFQKALGILSRRVYKRVTIERQTYRVLGMQNWSFAPAQTT